jgi:hypothetical protein
MMTKILSRKVRKKTVGEEYEDNLLKEMMRDYDLDFFRVIFIIACIRIFSGSMSIASQKIEYICHLLEMVYMDWDATTGALHFISILLLMAGVESNPGPTNEDQIAGIMPRGTDGRGGIKI